MKKCKYYVASNLQLVTECGVEGDYEYDSFCTYCGRKIKEVTKEAPQEIYDKVYENID